MCRNGENEELRYSIRSVTHFFPDAEIWLVGGKPSWYKGNYIPVRQGSNKYLNVRNNIGALISNENISSTFIYMNDDFFITEMPDFSQSYNRGTMEKYLEGTMPCCSNYVYIKLMNRSYNKIKKFIKTKPLNYELHIPLQITKAAIEKSYYKVDLWRSFYGNYYNIGGIAIDDCKIYENNVTNIDDLHKFISDHSPFLSTNDNSFKFVLDNYLATKFPNKTIYEA
jgi:hypothetical protein